jgi:hypothetical protein
MESEKIDGLTRTVEVAQGTFSNPSDNAELKIKKRVIPQLF